jgi:hypothetical protein
MFIIHQMGKVGSTAIFHALLKQQLNAVQTHSLSKKNLHANIDAFLHPSTSIERVKLEKELFFSQLMTTKLILDCQASHYHTLNSEQLPKIISLTRDPVERWISALTQNYQFHIQAAKEFYFLQAGHKEENDFVCLDFAFAQLSSLLQLDKLINFRKESDKKHRTKVEKILCKVHPTYGKYLDPLEDKAYRLGSPELHYYFWEIKHYADDKSNTLIRKLGEELMIPFYWFETNIEHLLNIDIYQFPLDNGTALIEHNNIELLFMKFETLKNEPERCEKLLSSFTGKEIKLEKVNVSNDKPGYKVMQQIKEKYAPIFKQLEAVRLSQFCQHFSYH